MHNAGRLRFIDGLRGVAALMVMVFHFGYPSVDAFKHGVFIFFVVSGFVICHSLRDTPIGLRSAGRFIGRRIVRLDPPYWATLAVCAFFVRAPLDSIVAHLFYLQSLLGYTDIIGVGWTLCIEVQFYLSFLVLRWISDRTKLHLGLVTLPLFIASLLTTYQPTRLTHPAGTLNAVTWLVPYYATFYLGIVTARAYVERSKLNLGFLAFGIIAALVRCAIHFNGWLLAAVVTATAIFLSSFGDRASRWLSNPIIQFFGRISYSLYLWHLFVYNYVLLYKQVDSRFLSFTTAVVLGTWAYLVVERPSIRLAKRWFGSGSEASTDSPPADGSNPAGVHRG